MTKNVPSHIGTEARNLTVTELPGIPGYPDTRVPGYRVPGTQVPGYSTGYAGTRVPRVRVPFPSSNCIQSYDELYGQRKLSVNLEVVSYLPTVFGYDEKCAQSHWHRGTQRHAEARRGKSSMSFCIRNKDGSYNCADSYDVLYDLLHALLLCATAAQVQTSTSGAAA